MDRLGWKHGLAVALLLVGALIVFFFSTANAGPINKGWNNVAIKGYDTVAYFTMSQAVKGKAEFEHVWQDARWRFVSAEHRDLFAKDPDRYAPRYGGFCAGGMALGRKARVDPEAWAIVNEQLYLTYSKRDRDKLVANSAETLKEADQNWAELDHE